MAKKRKANNPLKRNEIMARRLLRNKAMVYVAGVRDVIMFDTQTLDRVNTTQLQADCVRFYPWRWRVELSVICRDQSGSEYITSEMVETESRYKQSDVRLLDWLNTEHQRFLNTQNPYHKVTAAWVAIPVVDDKVPELDMRQLDVMYRKMGAFEYLSKWEHEQNQKGETA